MTIPIEPLGTGERAERAAAWNAEPKRAATVGELFTALSGQVTTLVNGEIELNKLKAKNFVKKIGMGGVLLAAAAVFALYLLGWVLRTVETAIALALPVWAASLIVTVLLLVAVTILAGLGASLLKKSRAHMPDPKEGLARDLDALKKGLGK